MQLNGLIKLISMNLLPHNVSELLKYGNNYSESQFLYFRLKNFSDLVCFTYISNLNPADILIPLIHAGGGGSNWTPPSLSPIIAVIEGKTKKQMIMISKKVNIKHLLTFLPIKLPKTVIYSYSSGRCIFHSNNH